MTKLPFPDWLDNTALTDYRSCERKAHWATFRQIEKPSPHLHAGKAFAAGLEAARRAYYIGGMSNLDAIDQGFIALTESYGDYEVPEDASGSAQNKTWLNTVYAYLHYFKTWPMDEDFLRPYPFANAQGIEFSFAVPLEINHPTTGNPILYCGRADMFALYKDAAWNVDDKTTASIGSYWADQWALRGQFMGYTWAGRQSGIDVRGTIVRGVSIQKTMNKDADAIQPYSQAIIDAWYKTTIQTVHDMIRSWERDYFRQDFGHSCAAYGGCPYKRLCESSDPEKWVGQYSPRTWDPLAKPDMS